jgi:2-polyprenyl-3-methyl-5-hydroxy-6-metoxy-1,4-benzoquinol methylase
MDYVTVTQCPLCQGNTSQTFDRQVFKGFPVENRICLECGLVFQSPRMSDQALEEFYTAEYRQVYQGDAGPVAKDIFVQEKRAVSLAGFVRDQTQASFEPACHLDIGSSTGKLLEQFVKEFSLSGIGVEPGKAYRTYALRRGLEVFASLEELQASKVQRFGLISLIHVLEHLSQPVDYLVELRQSLLSETGYLLVEVPNLYAHDSFEVAHLVSFSAHTLSEVLRKAGYKIVALRSHGEPRSRVLPLYLSALAKPNLGMAQQYKVCQETGVKRKRQFGMLRRRVLERLAGRWAWLPLPSV